MVYVENAHCRNCLCLADITFLVRRLRQLLADITFLEAYERTNRFLNVTVTAADTNEPPRMLNYLTAPHVVIWSAVACSSAFPGLFPAQELLARDSNGKFVKCTASESSAHSRKLITSCNIVADSLSDIETVSMFEVFQI